MANIKSVIIQGELPFDCAQDSQMANLLGQMNSPCLGIRITWGEARMQPNENGGQTAMYRFDILGEEAVSLSWVRGLVNTIKSCQGSITNLHLIDIENGIALTDQV